MDILRLGKLNDTTQHLYGDLVAGAIDAASSQLVIKLASDLEVAEHSSDVDGPVARSTMEALVSTLGDEDSLHAGMVQAWNGGRIALLADINGAQWTWLYTPLGQMNAMAVLHAIDTQQQASAAETWPAAYEKLEPIDLQSEQNAQDNLSTLTHVYIPDSSRVVLLHFRAVMERRVARLFLALRLFQLDHAGRLPAKLADICPTYLTHVPVDPFSGNSRTLSYVNDGKNPRVYSLGENGVDDGGTIRNVEDGFIHRWRDKGTIVYTYFRQVKE